MKLPLSVAFAAPLLCLTAAFGCISGASGGSGGAGATSSSTSGTGTGGASGSIVGGRCPHQCCESEWVGPCLDAGGAVETCSSPYCTGVFEGALCEPGPVLKSGQFPCGKAACSPGQVCAVGHPSMDGCTKHACMSPPPACAKTLTCACLDAHSSDWPPGASGGSAMSSAGLAGSNLEHCDVDAAGNVSVSYANGGF